MARRRDRRTKKQLQDRSAEIGPKLVVALDAEQQLVAAVAELERLSVETLAPLKEAVQTANEALYNASLVKTSKGLQPEELGVTVGKGRDKRRIKYQAQRLEIKERVGRTIVKEPMLDAGGNECVDGDGKTLMQAKILRIEFNLLKLEEHEPERVEIALG